MEEKEKESKRDNVIHMDTKGKEPKNTQRYSYEDLNKIASEMHQQLQNQDAYIKKLQGYVRELEATVQSKRMDYLFKVVELSMRSSGTYQFSIEFVGNCIDEIEEMLTIPEQETEKDESQNKE